MQYLIQNCTHPLRNSHTEYILCIVERHCPVLRKQFCLWIDISLRVSQLHIFDKMSSILVNFRMYIA